MFSADFLPHLPSLDIRDGALDYLFNVYKRILPSLGDYITNHGGQVNLSSVDVILAEVGSIEDHVFSMKYDNEQREKKRRAEFNQRKKNAKGRSLDAPPLVSTQQKPKAMGRAARILEKQQAQEHILKKQSEGRIISSHMKTKENLKAAMALKESMGLSVVKQDAESGAGEGEVEKTTQAADDEAEGGEKMDVSMSVEEDESTESKPKGKSGKKRKVEEIAEASTNKDGVGVVGDVEDEFDQDDGDDEEESEPEPIKIEVTEDLSPEVASAFKDKVKNEQMKKLDEYAKSVEDKVRLHEKGWKDRYYSDKCKADDVKNHGGREHLFRSYIVGLCWVMKYYYEGCPSWKWYYPFHYAPFASDLRNIERFQNDVKSLEQSTPFNPVEQLMAVLPSDSAHAIPKASRWLMSDVESPILDFYPTEVPVDPNGKAMPWLWVVLLPFIEEERLLAAM